MNRVGRIGHNRFLCIADYLLHQPSPQKNKTSSESFSDDVFLQMFLRFRAPQNHRVPVAEKTVFMFDRMAVHRADVFHA